MSEYLRPIDSRCTINGVSMPRPHSIQVNVKWNNLDAERDINTGHLILNPVNRIVSVKWAYKLLSDTQYQLIYNQVFQSSKVNYTKSFQTFDPNVGDRIVSFTTYEPDNFTPPEVAFCKNGHRYYKDIVFSFTSVAEVQGI